MTDVQLPGRRAPRAGVPVPHMAPWPLIADAARADGVRPDDVPHGGPARRRRRPGGGRAAATPARHCANGVTPRRGPVTRLRLALGTARRSKGR